MTNVFVHTAFDLQDVTVIDESGVAQTIDCTDEHPFYVEGQGWAEATALQAGEHLLSPDGGVLTVTSNVDDQRPAGVSVYNFEVEQDHTYFVEEGAGGTGSADSGAGNAATSPVSDEFVWVHNTCDGGGEEGGGGDDEGGGDEDRRPIQSGGNKIKPGTAKQLQETLGVSREDLHKAVEGMKYDNGIPPNDHGKFWSDGTYTTSDGTRYDLREYM